MEEIGNKEVSPAAVERESNPLEKEIFELEQKIAGKKKELEKSYAARETPEPKPAAPPPAGGPAVPPKSVPPSAKKPGAIESNPKIQALVNIAFHEGIHKAIEEVKKTNDPYLIDAFHDALIDEVYNMLIKEGLLKEV